MPTSAPETLLVLLLIVLSLGLLVELARFDHPSAALKASRRGPRPLRPRIPNDCQFCCAITTAGQPTSIGRPCGRRPQVSGRIQTAFVERLNLTIRRSIAGLARRSWSAAHSLSGLNLHFEWWRVDYHFARPHAGLRQPLGNKTSGQTRTRYRQQAPAQAAGLTDHRWAVLEVLTYPAPQLRVG